MFTRRLNLPELLKKKPFFLFGPRATGKTTLIEQSLPDAQIIDLLHSKTYATLVRNPSALGEIIVDPKKIVVIDEVQKLPELLDEVQRLIRTRDNFPSDGFNRTETKARSGELARRSCKGGETLSSGVCRDRRDRSQEDN